MVVTYKDWNKMLLYALHADHTIIITSMSATPLEAAIPSLRILKEAELDELQWAKQRFEQLNFIDEKRLSTICHHQLCQSRMAKPYNKKVRPKVF
jgi:hypothetical protein